MAAREDTYQEDMPLDQFIRDFGSGLMSAVQKQNPPVFKGEWCRKRQSVMAGLSREAFSPQQDVVQSVAKLLIDHQAPASVINGEMGTGKTIMAIALAAVMHAEGYKRTLVISPPHLVYKWRREINQTVPNAVVWILNGPDTLKKLLQLKAMREPPKVPTFFVMGRVRMRMGFNWRASFATRTTRDPISWNRYVKAACCTHCGELAEVTNAEGQQLPLSVMEAREHFPPISSNENPFVIDFLVTHIQPQAI
jgi:hypothetical protein